MTKNVSQMRREILEIPEAIERLLANGGHNIAVTASNLRALDPAFAITVARGSSDHACSYLKYAAEIALGIPVASVGPSIASLYGAKMRLKGGVVLSVSQSGQSPDIVEMTRSARRDRALSVAITNAPTSPLATSATHSLDMMAGPELSVAATKTFVSSMVTGLLLLAEWGNNASLRRAIHHLPAQLEKAIAVDWPEVRAAIGSHQSLFTLGRGPAWAISNEAALKFKETCQIHAESYSSAEVLHGPVSIVDQGFPVLCFAAEDAAEAVLAEMADRISRQGAQVFATSNRVVRAQSIDHVRTDHPLTDPISLIVSFYAMVEQLAQSRGGNPDAPRHLNKITETV
ncbi:SIS domain-containing protein [Parasedimentitalea maritima]|uniref:SIS domain-containing protein n=1 Tax=Parasedimentitalea maritima TaxID=2578117 RepID=A0ABY2UVB8_9RHOB|nr:SIS domain-containing protein [Zongyanglinia marina]TLP65586.1 SIS domain-containing protein [Zongyanglinia marina]